MTANGIRGIRTSRDKIRSLDEVAEIVARARAGGQVVALSHGCFDLLHLGHLRHLTAARREGTMLVVTVTADRFVNKGPGRPVFSQDARAEMLAALEYVDLVAVNDAADAVAMLRRIKPDVYVKGGEYQEFGKDVTGKIAREAEAVAEHGGRIAFTHDITYSSSNLINKHLNLHDPEVARFLDEMRDSDVLERIAGYLERIKDYRVLLVGDAIIDEYRYVAAMGKSPKEMMIATLFQSMERFAGGVFAAANHLASFCRQVDIVTALGGAESHEQLVRDSLRPNVGLTPITVEGRPTTLKCRFVDEGYMRKLFEVYHMDDSPVAAHRRREIDHAVAERAGDYDLVIVTDFGHGLMARSTIDTVTRTSRFLAVNAQSNSANHGYNLITKYPRADYVCIDAPEARLAVGDKGASVEHIAERVLPDMVAVDRLILTHGKHGCVARETGCAPSRIPAFTKTVVDTVGAGDAFLAVTSPLVAAGMPMRLVGLVGNAVGAIKVGIVGHRASVEKVSLVKFLTALLK